uniref:CCHC-type domain-containing protein n=1 Tax=Macaca fascicularis TaxID=9541 RepID=A0A7N9DDN2_MACFA
MAMPIQIQCPQYQPVENKTQPPVVYQYWPPADLQYQLSPENPYGQPGTFPAPQGRAPYPQPPTMRLNPTAPPSTQGSAVHKIIDEARKQGDIEAWQFPVILEARPPGEGAQEGEPPVAEARYQSFSIKMLKEMKEGVKQYGPNSPYMRTLLDSIAHGHRLIPYDWEILAKSSLSPSQFLQFKTWWIDEAQVQVRRNRTANPPINIDADQLLGIGQNWSTVDQQVIMPNEAIEQIRAICLRAWEKIQDPGTTCPSFNTIRQGSKEPYPDFVARLQDATQKSITDENARKVIVELMAYENTNLDCQSAFKPLKGRVPAGSDVISEYVKACNGIGGAMHKAMLMAQAITGVALERQVRTFGGKCYNCGQIGHLKKNCLVSNKQNVTTEATTTTDKEPPGLCPRCKKGKHWGNQCRSKFDKNGQPLSGNEKGPASGPAPNWGIPNSTLCSSGFSGTTTPTVTSVSGNKPVITIWQLSSPLHKRQCSSRCMHHTSSLCFQGSLHKKSPLGYMA